MGIIIIHYTGMPMGTIRCLCVLAKAVQGGDRSNIRLSQGRILDRSWPVK